MNKLQRGLLLIGLLHCTLLHSQVTTSKVTVENNGNKTIVSPPMGIGTTNPSGLLHIVGGFSGGTGDFTNITNPSLKIEAPGHYSRSVYLSGNPNISTVFNFETGKHVYWGEPGDQGKYYFRGRDVILENEMLGIGTTSPSADLHIVGDWGTGTGDFTNITHPVFKVQSLTQYIRVPYLSAHSNISTVFNFETGKDVYWGEPGDTGKYFFRGRTTIFQQNNVGIGTDNPGYKLEVAGTVRANTFSAVTPPWPDYVFEPNYELRDLTEVDQYLKAHKHLPDIPSEKELQATGLDLPAMDAKLLRKIEELTLYLIEQNKLIKAQGDRISELEKLLKK